MASGERTLQGTKTRRTGARVLEVAKERSWGELGVRISYGGFRIEGEDELLFIEDAQETSAEALRLWDLAKGREKSSSEWEVGQALANGAMGGEFGLFRVVAGRLQEAS